jgi:vacuolar-type H+-ATPase subunit E/Vma4
MDKETNNKDKLIKGIQKDAEEESLRIVAEAEKEAGERLKAVEIQAASILKEAENNAQSQIQAIDRWNKSTIIVETRRIILKKRGDIIQNILNRVEEKLTHKVKEANYQEILLNWIIEAVIGLNAEEAAVNASKEERELIIDALLKRAEKRVEEIIHIQVNLGLSSEPPLIAQGVVLKSKDGKMAFNNQVPTRLLRYQSEIRKLIYNHLFSETGEE